MCDPRPVTLGYAATVHSHQGVTADTCHAILSESASRTMAYVAMTRGREHNHAYINTREPGEAESHHHHVVRPINCVPAVGRKPTTLVPLSGEVADQVRATVEGWWKAAEPIGEPPVAEAGPEQDAGESEPEQAGDEPQAP